MERINRPSIGEERRGSRLILSLPPRHNMVRPSPVERLVTNTALSKSSETGDLHQNDQEQLRLWHMFSSFIIQYTIPPPVVCLSF